MFKLKNFTFKYDNVNILNNVSGNFIIENEINIIFGDNGCGKTSLIEVLNLQNEQYVGEVSYLGKNYKDLSKKEKLSLKNTEFGFVPQKLNLIEDLSAIENLEIVANKKYNEEYYEKLLLKLNISKSMQTKNVKNLSGGMKQRVAIARALVNNPRIIFFDEPTANLDFKNIDNFIDIIDELKTSGVTVIIITHEDIFFEKFKYIIEVENTKVIPTYRIEEKVEEINFLKVKKPNLKIINKSQKLLKILIAVLIFFAMYITCFYTAPYMANNLDLSISKDDLIYIVVPTLMYVIVFVVISIILVLITRRNNHSLAILGHAKQKIKWNNINLVNCFIILSSLIIILSTFLNFTDVTIEQVFPIMFFVMLISIVINIIVNFIATKLFK